MSERITRRGLLQRGGQLGLALAGAPAFARGAEEVSEQREALSRRNWEQLRRSLNGALLRPGDPRYASYPKPYNLRFAHIRPAGIAQCVDATDVAKAVRWARQNGVRVAARAGGHSYAGYSTTQGLLIDVSRLKRVVVGSGLAHFGAGVLNHDVAEGIRSSGVAIPAGRCPSVGLSGLLLGGGFGFSSRKYGLTCDSLVQTRVVTADGDIVTCSESENPDLFWACRGGGGGNFGINVGYTLRTFPVGSASVFRLVWGWDAAVQVLRELQLLVATGPDEFSVRFGATVKGPPDRSRRQKSVAAIGQYLGSSQELLDLLAPVLQVASPASMVVEALPYWEAQDFLRLDAERERFANHSRYVAQPIPDQGLETLIDWLDRWPGSFDPHAGAQGSAFGWGGAINRVPSDATAFVHRDELLLFQLETAWGGKDPGSLVRAQDQWVDGAITAMQPYLTESSYQNFIDPELPQWRQAYYGDNFQRLREVKRAYDPGNFFRFAQSIPPG